MRAPLVIVCMLLGLLLLAAAMAWYAWVELGDVEIGMHGWIALGVGAVLTLKLGMFLMWLVYHSHRKGYDDEAGHD